MFEWISYEGLIPKVKVTFNGKDCTTGEEWSETKEAFRIAPHMILEIFEGNEFVIRILDEELYRDKSEIVIDDETYDQFVKTFAGSIDGISEEWVEANGHLLTSEIFIEAIESLVNNK
jgi:hypothetical protein